MKNIFQKPKNKAPVKEFESNYQGTDMPQTIYDEARRFSDSQTNTRKVIHTEFLGNKLDKLNKKQLKCIRCAQFGVREWKCKDHIVTFVSWVIYKMPTRLFIRWFWWIIFFDLFFDHPNVTEKLQSKRSVFKTLSNIYD